MISMFTTVLAGLFPTYIIRFSILGIPTNLFEVGVWGVFALTLAISKERKQFFTAIRMLPGYIKLFVCLFLVSAIVSTLFSPILLSSLGILKGWIITPIIFGLLVRAAAYNDQNIRKNIVRSLVLSGVVAALLGLSQIHGFNRVISLYDVPNSLALFLVPVFIIAIWTGIQKKDRFYVLSSLVILAAIIATQSFGAIIAIVGTGLLVVIPGLTRDPRRPGFRLGGRNDNVAWFICATVLVVLLVFTLSGRVQYLISPITHPNTTNSTTVRLQLWDIGLRLIKKHPILGIGLGQFEPAYQVELHRLFEQQESGLIPEYVFRDPHNWIISFWLNTGLLGLLSFIGLNYVVIAKSIPSPVLGEGGGEGRAVYHQAAAFALISILIFGLFDTIYWKNDLSALWWMLLIFIFG